MMPIVLVLAMAAITPASLSAALESPTRHIRTSYPYVGSLLRDGFYKSQTFARLVTRLERSDVIVYIEMLPQMPSGIEGRLMMLTRAHGVRYVRIQLGNLGSTPDEIALLAHELEHATEIADAPDVTDMTGFVALYERIGQRSGWHQYETAAAQDAARRVRQELA